MANSLAEKILNWLFERRVYTRCVFFVTFLMCASIDYYYSKVNLTGIYILPITIAGFAFYSTIWIRIFLAGVSTYTRYKLAPYSSPGAGIFALQWLTYFIVTEATSSLIRNRIREKEHTLNLTMALAKSLDTRDPYTAYHSENVANYALMIAKEMKLSKTVCHNIYVGGLLHDIGKIGLPETILSKPSKLTDGEFEKIKQHPVTGYETLKHVSSFEKNGVLDMVLYHHERYDGKGYPTGLKGDQIPQAARIMAVADSFDAMTSRRVYRQQNSLEYAVKEIRKSAGAQFDPEIAEIFLGIVKREGSRILRKHNEDEKNKCIQLQKNIQTNLS